ncbi:MAG: mechanosensitive ion channel domain-containing protein [Woeseiaceae bacterium]
MKQTQWLRCALFALGLLATSFATSQESEDPAQVQIPELNTLHSTGWAYFAVPAGEIEERAEAFFAQVEEQLAELAPQNEEVAIALLESVRDNIAAYAVLLEEPEIASRVLETAPLSYGIDQLLQLARDARDARASAAEEQVEVQREERILAGATRRRDTAFGEYVDAEDGDQRWLAGLRLLQARSAQAISERRLEILTLRFEHAAAYAEAVDERVELAKERLATSLDEDGLAQLVEKVGERRADVDAAVDELREAELAAAGLEIDNAEGRSQQRLIQARRLDAEVNLALAETMHAQASAKRWWVELQLDTGKSIDTLNNRLLTWNEFLRDVDDQMPEWRTATEEELLAVQGISRDDLNRASLRLLDQRSGTAQATLTKVGDLGAAVDDLRLIISAVDIAAAEHTGAFGTLLSTIKLGLKTAYIRTTNLAEVTLFSIGEAPVTGGDILRVMLIMIAAMLLSRGIRHTIKRVGHGESSGTQASLYTVGRLTHYVIIILAVFIALSSVGIDFGNLALVAGALSVGIGFGLQSIVNNFVSGLIILFEHSLRVGDYIELDTGLTGTVKSINVRSTLINTNDNIDIVVPNSEFVTARLQNWTLGERVLRVRIPFGVAYGSDKELVKQAALEAANEVPYTLTHMKGREPDAWLTEFGDNSLNFLLLVWVNRQGARRPTRTRSAYLWALETKLTEYGIEIPFPQRDLHLRSGWPADSDGQLDGDPESENIAGTSAPSQG